MVRRDLEDSLSSSMSPKAQHPRGALAGTGEACLQVQHNSQKKCRKPPRQDADSELKSSFPSWLGSHSQPFLSHGLPTSHPSLAQRLQAQAANRAHHTYLPPTVLTTLCSHFSSMGKMKTLCRYLNN